MARDNERKQMQETIPDDVDDLRVVSNGHVCWFKDDAGNEYIPKRWMLALIDSAYKKGCKDARSQIRFALGMKVPGIEAGDAYDMYSP